MMGITELIEWDATFAKFERLLIPMALQGTGRPSGFATEWVHEQLLATLGDNLAKFDAPKIYLSRESARKRRVINEAELLGFLRPLGYESFQLEKLSTSEQIALFTQAKFILGPHGAGFANSIHSAGATLLEFFEPSYVNPCYYRLAAVRNFNYAVLFAESDGLNMRVNIELLEQVMVKLNLI
jgi:capsular polysaccharide biosynthesis protein